MSSRWHWSIWPGVKQILCLCFSCTKFTAVCALSGRCLQSVRASVCLSAVCWRVEGSSLWRKPKRLVSRRYASNMTPTDYHCVRWLVLYYQCNCSAHFISTDSETGSYYTASHWSVCSFTCILRRDLSFEYERRRLHEWEGKYKMKLNFFSSEFHFSKLFFFTKEQHSGVTQVSCRAERWWQTVTSNTLKLAVLSDPVWTRVKLDFFMAARKVWKETF